MSSPFAIAGPGLRDNGISVLPIMPGAKAPGTITGGTWRLEHGWSRFCDRLPTKFEMGAWVKWPDAGVGVALGTASGRDGQILVCLDFDTDDARLIGCIHEIVDPSPVRKKGRKGWGGFYRANPAVENRSYNINGERVLDLLAHGRQTVLPPTIHPSGGEYVWLGKDTLENLDFDDLPELPDDIGDRLAEVLAPFGYSAPIERGPAQDVTLAGESIHRELNDAALLNLDAWVPALQLYGCTRSGGHYRAVAHWRSSASGRPLAKRSTNLSIAPEGIKDFGDADKGYTPLDLVMAACGADLDTAFRWLQDHVAPQKPVVLAAKPVASDTVPAPQKKHGNLAGLIDPNAEPIAEEETSEEQVEEAAVEIVAAGAGQVIPDAVCFPPGILGETVEWIVDSADTPSPQLSLGAAISLLGGLMGRRFEGPTRARTNFYGVGVAPTGFGKDHPMKACVTLAYAAGLHKFIGPEDVKSDSAIRKLLEARPSVSLFIDEFGGYLKKILDRRAAAHDKRSRDMLLTLFSRANGIYGGSEGATEKAVPIMNPNLGVYGVSTPSDLWGAFSSASAEDGLLPRFIVYSVPEGRPEIVEASADPSEPPMALIQRLRAMMDVRPKGNLNGVGGNVNKPIRAEWGEGAAEWFSVYRNMKREEAIVSGGMREIVASRQAEHVIKLALVYAVGCAPEAPVITVASLEWARIVAECSGAALLGALESRVADSDKQAEYLWVLRTVREAGADGLKMADLVRAVRGKFDKRRFDDILGQLEAAEEVEKGIRSTAKGGKPTMRVWARGAMAEAA